MSQQVVSILVSAGGIILAAGIIATARSIFKAVKAIGANTAAVAELGVTLNRYIHESSTRATVMEGDINDLKTWRLQVESTNRTAAYGSGGGTQ